MSRLRFVLAVFGLELCSSLSACAGCSEPCEGNEARAGCPCWSDRDCDALTGELLLCVDGACAAGDPPDAPSPLGTCAADSDCASGAVCGVSGECHVAPRCQRLDVATLSSVDTSTRGVGAVTRVALDDCSHIWELASPTGQPLLAGSVRFSIDLDGTFAFEPGADPSPCSRGQWRAGLRAGVLQCGDVTYVVTTEGNAEAVCIGTACAAGCRLIEQGTDADHALGVCLP